MIRKHWWQSVQLEIGTPRVRQKLKQRLPMGSQGLTSRRIVSLTLTLIEQEIKKILDV